VRETSGLVMSGGSLGTVWFDLECMSPVASLPGCSGCHGCLRFDVCVLYLLLGFGGPELEWYVYIVALDVLEMTLSS